MRAKGIFLTILSALIYGFVPSLCSMTYLMGNNAVTLTFYRGVMILPILFLLMKKNGINFSCTKDEIIKIGIVAILGSTLTSLLLYGSIRYIGAGSSTTLHFLYPLFVVLICHYIYKDILTKRHIVALFISTIGVILFMDFKDFDKIKCVIMGLVSGFTFSIYLVGIEKFRLSRMNDYKLSFYLALFMSIFVFFYGIITREFIFHQPIQAYLLMMVISVLAQLIAVICLKKGIDILGSSLASMFSMFEPVSSVFFGVLLLGETITIVKSIGCILILLGVISLVKK